jgi:signal transduction histidine kinase
VPRLIVIKGPDEGKQFELTVPIAGVGRDAKNTIHLCDTEISRRHAEFRQNAAGGYTLIDIGSANGCLLNNKLTRQAELKQGDHITIGQTILFYSAGQASSAPATDLADRIRILTRSSQEAELSAIIKTVGENTGSQILARPEHAGTPWLRTRLANLAVMYETIQTVSHILDLDQMIERIMDLVFKSIEADCGCIMLRNPESEQLEPKAVRTRLGVVRAEPVVISRTIMDYVLREKAGVLVNDAAQDQRFNTGQSILRFNIHEALCVPMKGRHDTLGVLYLDTQTKPRDAAGKELAGVFTEDHLHLAIAIAHQAALAIEDTRYHAALVNAERLAAVGQTMAAMSHHIKNILQGLQSGGELVNSALKTNDHDLLRAGWRLVEKNQAKIFDLVKDMLSYSKEREPNYEPTDVNAVASEVVELVQGRNRRAKVRADLASHLPLVPVDAEGLHRALLNLVSNALDAVEAADEPEVTVQTVVEPAGWVQIRVIDNGTGIAADQLEAIFKPFVSTKGSRGTGLGLAVSRKTIREHGGDLTVTSTPGTGSQFTVRLPVRSPTPDGSATKFDIPPLPN